MKFDQPPAHASGAHAPSIPSELVPRHVAVVMDGNGRWANSRGLPRIEGHRVGEATLMDVIAGAIEIGVSELSAYAFSTENWKRSPSEVRFIMGFSRKMLREQRDDLNAWGVQVKWVGRVPKMWKSVLKELHSAEELTRNNTKLVLNLCINYGGRLEIVDAARALGQACADGRIKPKAITERTLTQYMYAPEMNDVDLFIRTGGEQRTSNFLMWQSAYAELYFSDLAWPDFDRIQLWKACEAYSHRERRFGGAIDNVRAGTIADGADTVADGAETVADRADTIADAADTDMNVEDSAGQGQLK